MEFLSEFKAAILAKHKDAVFSNGSNAVRRTLSSDEVASLLSKDWTPSQKPGSTWTILAVNIDGWDVKILRDSAKTEYHALSASPLNAEEQARWEKSHCTDPKYRDQFDNRGRYIGGPIFETIFLS